MRFITLGINVDVPSWEIDSAPESSIPGVAIRCGSGSGRGRMVLGIGKNGAIRASGDCRESSGVNRRFGVLARGGGDEGGRRRREEPVPSGGRRRIL